MKKNIKVISFFCFVSLFISTQECCSETASELIVAARVLSRDPSSTGRVRFTDSQILSLLNEAQRDTIGATLCIRDAYSFDTSSGTQYYDLPSNYIQVDRLIHDDQRLDEKSPAKLDQTSKEWATETGEPINFFINFASRTKVGFFPYPVTNTSTHTVIVEYYSQADTMTASDTPYNAISEFAPFHQMLSYYAGAQLLYIDGMISMADRYMQRYISYRDSFNNYCRARAGYYPNTGVAPSR